MYARVTPYKMKADHIEAATALMKKLRSDILSLPGMKHFINVMKDDGSGMIVALVDSQAVSDSNQDAIQALWANFSDHLEKPPSAEGYDVVANWSN